MSTLIAQAAALEQQNADAFRLLALSLADNEPCDPATIAEVCRAAGKTPADLSALVGRKQRRRQLLATLATKADNEAARRRVQGELSALDAAREAFLKQNAAAAAPLVLELGELVTFCPSREHRAG